MSRSGVARRLVAEQGKADPRTDAEHHDGYQGCQERPPRSARPPVRRVPGRRACRWPWFGRPRRHGRGRGRPPWHDGRAGRRSRPRGGGILGRFRIPYRCWFRISGRRWYRIPGRRRISGRYLDRLHRSRRRLNGSRLVARRGILSRCANRAAAFRTESRPRAESLPAAITGSRRTHDACLPDRLPPVSGTGRAGIPLPGEGAARNRASRRGVRRLANSKHSPRFF